MQCLALITHWRRIRRIELVSRLTVPMQLQYNGHMDYGSMIRHPGTFSGHRHNVLMYSMPSHVSLNLGKNVLVHDRLKLSSDWLFLSVFVANWGITNTVDLVHVDNSQSILAQCLEKFVMISMVCNWFISNLWHLKSVRSDSLSLWLCYMLMFQATGNI